MGFFGRHIHPITYSLCSAYQNVNPMVEGILSVVFDAIFKVLRLVPDMQLVLNK